jgi:hypothetical protein
MKRAILWASLMLLGLYVVSYIALLEPQVSVAIGLPTRYTRNVFFRGAGTSDFVMTLYKPLLALDQWIRPDYWSWTEK